RPAPGGSSSPRGTHSDPDHQPTTPVGPTMGPAAPSPRAAIGSAARGSSAPSPPDTSTATRTRTTATATTASTTGLARRPPAGGPAGAPGPGGRGAWRPGGVGADGGGPPGPRGSPVGSGQPGSGGATIVGSTDVDRPRAPVASPAGTGSGSVGSGAQTSEPVLGSGSTPRSSPGRSSSAVGASDAG